MYCEQARQLFDAYLDGELSPSQVTELSAHRARCADCRRSLALMEVAGHLLTADREAVQTSFDFTDRLLACVEVPRVSRMRRFVRGLYIGGPLAAAAVVALAFLGVFDSPGRRGRVLGQKEYRTPDLTSARRAPQTSKERDATTGQPEESSPKMEQVMERVRQNMTTFEELNLTTLQWLEYLRDVRHMQGEQPGPASTGSPKEPKQDDDAEETDPTIEDL
ncbi:MAG: zf-HC2 domain-containing protein [Planctomycetota bacterium]